MSIHPIGHSRFYAISASGLADASLRLDNTANNIANSSPAEFRPAKVNSAAMISGGAKSNIESDSVQTPLYTNFTSQTDYATEGINLILARRAFEANLITLKSGIESESTLIDIIR